MTGQETYAVRLAMPLSTTEKILEYSDFTQVRQGNEGVRKGKALIEELSKKFANGYALVVVAGMNYAEFVEAMENKNVLASAS